MKTLFKISAILLTVGLTSCSTVFRTKTHTINVFTNAAEAKVTVNDSVYSLPAKIKLLRSKKPVTLSYQSENKQFDTIVSAVKGPVFYLGNLPSLPFFGVGYWVDLTTQKRFKYPKNIFLNDKDGLEIQEYKADRYIAKRNITDTVRQLEIRENINKHFAAADAKRKVREQREFKRYNPTEGAFKFNIQPPTLSLMGFSSKNTNVDYFSNSVGGMGFGIGGDYYYKDNRFISLELSHRVNQFSPPGLHTEYDFLAHNLNISLRKGHRWQRLEYSYGLAFNLFDTEYSQGNRSVYNTYNTLGFSGLFSYQLTSVMYIGVRYNPSVYNLKSFNKGFDYGHVLGIDYRIKF